MLCVTCVCVCVCLPTAAVIDRILSDLVLGGVWKRTPVGPVYFGVGWKACVPVSGGEFWEDPRPPAQKRSLRLS